MSDVDLIFCVSIKVRKTAYKIDSEPKLNLTYQKCMVEALKHASSPVGLEGIELMGWMFGKAQAASFLTRCLYIETVPITQNIDYAQSLH